MKGEIVGEGGGTKIIMHSEEFWLSLLIKNSSAVVLDASMFLSVTNGMRVCEHFTKGSGDLDGDQFYLTLASVAPLLHFLLI